MKLSQNIELLKDRFYVFYDYVIKTEGASYFIEEAKRIFDNAYTKKDIKQLHSIDKELNVWLREMFRPKEKEEIEALFRAKFGEDALVSNQVRLRQINTIIKRGRINSNSEYNLLFQRVDEIYSDVLKKDELLKLNELLSAFHNR